MASSSDPRCHRYHALCVDFAPSRLSFDPDYYRVLIGVLCPRSYECDFQLAREYAIRSLVWRHTRTGEAVRFRDWPIEKHAAVDSWNLDKEFTHVGGYAAEVLINAEDVIFSIHPTSTLNRELLTRTIEGYLRVRYIEFSSSTPRTWMSEAELYAANARHAAEHSAKMVSQRLRRLALSTNDDNDNDIETTDGDESEAVRV